MPPLEPAAGLSHELDVLRRRWVWAGLAVIVVSMVVTFAAMWGFERAFARRDRAVDRPRSAVSAAPSLSIVAPLQPSIGHDAAPVNDLDAMHRNENSVFAAMGWTIDGRTGQPTIPPAVVAAVSARRPATHPTIASSTTEATR